MSVPHSHLLIYSESGFQCLLKIQDSTKDYILYILSLISLILEHSPFFSLYDSFKVSNQIPLFCVINHILYLLDYLLMIYFALSIFWQESYAEFYFWCKVHFLCCARRHMISDCPKIGDAKVNELLKLIGTRYLHFKSILYLHRLPWWLRC